MFVLPRSQNPLCGYFNDEAFYLIDQKEPDIVPKKKIHHWGVFKVFKLHL